MSISHQCHDPDQQINIENFHPKNGHNKEEDMPECMKGAKKTMEKLTNWDPNNHDLSYWNY